MSLLLMQRLRLKKVGQIKYPRRTSFMINVINASENSKKQRLQIKKEFVIGCIYSGGVDIATLNDKAACFVVWIKENIKARRLIVTSLK
ncbi:hypothetical protein ACOJCD_003988 [Cronobacter dublinensis]